MNSDLKQTPDEEMDVRWWKLSPEITRGRFSEDEPYEIGFAEYYETNLRSLFEKHAKVVEVLDQQRKPRTRRGHWRFFPVAVTVLVFVWYGLSLTDWPRSFDDWAFLCMIALVLTFFIFLWAYKGAMRSPKGTGDLFQGCSMEKDIFPRILSFLGEFQCKFGRIPNRISQYSDFGIVPSYEKENSDNRIIGAYKGVEFDLFETHLTETRGSGKARQTVTVFKGMVISLSLNKTFEGKTVVKKDRGRLVNWTRDKLSDLEVVRLEDPRFEKEFEVYSTDQVEARYLLTGTFMERLVKVRYAFLGTAITCSFYQNQLLMMIPISASGKSAVGARRDVLFVQRGGSPGEFLGIAPAMGAMDQCKSLLKEMNRIFQIIDILKLDSDIRL